jgi:1,4-alpha-glucan branching enzyme
MAPPTFDLLERRKDKFMLWLPAGIPGAKPPYLVLGTFDKGPPPAVYEFNISPFVKSDQSDLWELDPNSISPALKDDTIYYYWYEIDDLSPEGLGAIQVTDPLAYTIDYSSLRSRGDHDMPASVIKFRGGKLWPCDIDGSEPNPPAIPSQDSMPANNHMVIYELPTSWSRYKDVQENGQDVQIDVGTFLDVLALFDLKTAGNRFKGIPQIDNEAIVADLGINALELLPAADARPIGQWGYATANYYATDFDLGTSSQLVKLVEKIHSLNTRLFTDVVMAFGHEPYCFIDFKQFHLDQNAPEEQSSPDRLQSHSNQPRDGYGGRLWRYSWPVDANSQPEVTTSYDPETGKVTTVHPSWAFHKGHLHRWMTSFGVDGLRLDSINNIANYDFIKAYKESAWAIYNSRYSSPDPAKFLVIGEELSDPLDLITSGTLNALWNEPFQGRLRATILGESTDGDDFEWTVRKMADCRLDNSHPFTDGSQAINYITSHDTEGYRKERLYNFLSSNNVTDMERRSKFAFALFLTSVGIPMIFAGEEFLDQMDRPISDKQSDPVNYERKADDWRTRIFNYVANMVAFRKTCPALGTDDTDFIHVDESRGGKIMAWKRGGNGTVPVVVVANFTDEDTDGSEYVVNNWPDKGVAGWREVTQGRDVPGEWVGREPLMHWEVKVYTYWRG